MIEDYSRLQISRVIIILDEQWKRTIPRGALSSIQTCKNLYIEIKITGMFDIKMVQFTNKETYSKNTSENGFEKPKAARSLNKIVDLNII